MLPFPKAHLKAYLITQRSKMNSSKPHQRFLSQTIPHPSKIWCKISMVLWSIITRNQWIASSIKTFSLKQQMHRVTTTVEVQALIITTSFSTISSKFTNSQMLWLRLLGPSLSMAYLDHRLEMDHNLRTKTMVLGCLISSRSRLH